MKRRHIDLALQGGGTHGAFTWGVLDRLLQDERLQFDAISGSSAGAMNAVALAAGWADGGRSGAREALGRFWSRVADRLQLAQWAGPWLGSTSMLPASPLSMALDMASSWLANGSGNPLRTVLQEEVDFDAVRRCESIRLFIGATHVRSGRLRVFRREEIDVDAVLASACLPLLFPAVVIDGEAYWDGGYMGNPSLVPLLNESAARDLLLVQVHPSQRQALPVSPSAIVDRINEIGFHGSLVKELRSLAILQQLMRDEGLDGERCRTPLLRKAHGLRVHRIEGGEQLDPLATPGPLQTPWHHLLDLHRAGHAAAEEWLQANYTHLGRHGTVDLVAEYLDDGPAPPQRNHRRSTP